VGYLLPYIRKYWKMFGVAVLFLAIEAFVDLLQPTLMAKIIDIGVAEQNMNYVFYMGGIMLLVTAVGAGAASTRSVLASRVSQRFGTEMRSDLFRKIVKLSYADMDRFDRASLVTRLTNDVTQVQMFTNGLMRIFVKAPLVCIGSLIMAIRLDPQLGIVLAVVVPIVAFLVFLNLRTGFPRFIKVQQALDRLNGVMREFLSAIRLVKAFNRSEYETEKFDHANDDYKKNSIRVLRMMAVFNPAILLTVNFGIVAVIWLGGLGVNDGTMQVGHIVAFINYMTQILFSLMMISMVFNMFVRAKASAARIGEVFAQNDSMRWKQNSDANRRSNSEGRIDFDNVSFSYEGAEGAPALKRIRFSCLPGETVGIIGSTGSGKSTLVGLLPRFYDATEGTVKIDGVDIRDMSEEELRNRIAIVPQKTVLFSGTIADNLRWGDEGASQEELEEAARTAQAHDFIASFPEGYETRLGQRGVNLSGGQKQRLSIARALLRKPSILILDDSTSAVDAATESRMRASLKRFAQGLTCLIIAQRISSVMDADKIVVLDMGEIVGVGTHDELIQTCGVYREIYQSQYGKEMLPHAEAR